MAISSEDLPPTAMPQETQQFGEGSQFKRQQRAFSQAGSPNAPQPGNPPVTGPPGNPAQPPGGPSPQPTQPAPYQPLRPEDLRPGGPVFSEPKLRPTYPWRQELRLWSAHPEAGPFMAALRRRADANLEQQPPPPPQQ